VSVVGDVRTTELSHETGLNSKKFAVELVSVTRDL